MRGRAEQPVGPRFEHVSDVHDEHAGIDRDVDPALGRRHDLEARIPGVQECQALVVGVRAHVHGRRVHDLALAHVVQQTKLRHRLGHVLGHCAGRQPQMQLESRANQLAECRDLIVVGRDGPFEAGKVGPDVRAKDPVAGEIVRIVVRQVEPEVEGFVAAVHFVRIIALLGERDVAAMVRAQPDVVLSLQGFREFEEALRHPVGPFDQREVDAVPGDPEEPGLAAGAADFVGDPSDFAGVAGSQTADVDQRQAQRRFRRSFHEVRYWSSGGHELSLAIYG